MKNDKVIVSVSKPQEILTETTDIAFTAKLTYKLQIIYGIPFFAVLIPDYCLDTGPFVSLIHLSMIPSSCTNRIKREKVP